MYIELRVKHWSSSENFHDDLLQSVWLAALPFVRPPANAYKLMQVRFSSFLGGIDWLC